MATSTLINKIDQTDSGGSVLSKDTSHRREIETFVATAAITSGNWVVFDTDMTDGNRVLGVKTAPATAGNPLVVGVAIDTATASGQKVRVVVSGYAEGVNVVTGVLKGEALASSGATAGRALKYASGTHTNCGPCGVALEDAASNAADVWVFKRF